MKRGRIVFAIAAKKKQENKEKHEGAGYPNWYHCQYKSSSSQAWYAVTPNIDVIVGTDQTERTGVAKKALRVGSRVGQINGGAHGSV